MGKGTMGGCLSLEPKSDAQLATLMNKEVPASGPWDIGVAKASITDISFRHNRFNLGLPDEGLEERTEREILCVPVVQMSGITPRMEIHMYRSV